MSVINSPKTGQGNSSILCLSFKGHLNCGVSEWAPKTVQAFYTELGPNLPSPWGCLQSRCGTGWSSWLGAEFGSWHCSCGWKQGGLGSNFCRRTAEGRSGIENLLSSASRAWISKRDPTTIHRFNIRNPLTSLKPMFCPFTSGQDILAGNSNPNYNYSHHLQTVSHDNSKT